MIQFRKYNFYLFLILFSLITKNCTEKTILKPKSYFRIIFPEKVYKRIQSDCPYSFTIPNYSKWVHGFKKADLCNNELIFPEFKAELICKYEELDSNLNSLIHESFSSADEHKRFADAIEVKNFENHTDNVYGKKFRFTGESAVKYKFFLTDSTEHFLSGELLFNVKPNYDSLKPIIKFIEKDIDKMISSFKWE